MSKESNFHRSVVRHLKNMGFSCMVQSKSFPDIVAWKPFTDDAGRSLVVNTQINLAEDSYSKLVIPFFITLIKCKESGKLTTKEKSTAIGLLEENRCNSFIVASRDKKKKLDFNELTFNTPRRRKSKREKPTIPSYI